MKTHNVIDLRNLPEVDLLTQLIEGGVRRLVAQAMEAEVEVFISAVAERQKDGRSRVVRNGYLPERDIMTGVGQVKVKVPRIRDCGEGEEKIHFKSSLIPPYMRRTATLEKVLPLLYLKGLSEANFVEVLAPMLGDEARNLSPGVISRLKSS